MPTAPPAAEVRSVRHDRVVVDDEFWSPYVERVHDTVRDYQYEQLEASGCLDNFRIVAGRADGEFTGRWFQDSDAYKWLEAASYLLATRDDPELRARVDEVIDLVADAQQPDGYLDTYVTLEWPERRWTNLTMVHELYCAGHLIEAAVAHHEATGEETLLDVAVGVADRVDAVFGPDGRDGTPGHEEIELALVKLARVTGEGRYRDLAAFFVDQRGRGALEREFENSGERAGDEAMWEGMRSVFFEDGTYDGSYAQDHAPVREHEAVEGHAVRAMYLYTGVADLVLETGDEELLETLLGLWENMTEKRTYVTGGIGSTHEGERFTRDYHLPNETSYAETCASVGSVLWSDRLFRLTGDARYPDLVERTLYNAFLAGVSLDLTRFFYANAHEVGPAGHALADVDPQRFSNQRQGWFETACCPPNAARMLASLSGHVYGQGVDDDAVYVRQFVGSEATLEVGDADLTLRQESALPWDGEVTLTADPDAPVAVPIRVRVPEWCTGVSAAVNGEAVPADADDAYLAVEREWTAGDELAITFEMAPELLVAHPAVDADRGKVALRRGPLVYCLEGVDHDRPLAHYAVPADADVEATHRPDLLEGVTTLEGTARVPAMDDWDGALYRRAADVERTDAPFTAVPFYAWANRDPGEMRVWLQSP